MKRNVAASALAVSMLIASCSSPAMSGSATMVSQTSESVKTTSAILDSNSYSTTIAESIKSVDNISITGTSTTVSSGSGGTLDTTSTQLVVLSDGLIVGSDISLTGPGGQPPVHVRLAGGSVYINPAVASPGVGAESDKEWVLINEAYASQDPVSAKQWQLASEVGARPLIYRLVAATRDVDYLGSSEASGKLIYHYRTSIPLSDLIAGSSGLERDYWLADQSRSVKTYDLETWVDSQNRVSSVLVSHGNDDWDAKAQLDFEYDLPGKTVSEPDPSTVYTP